MTLIVVHGDDEIEVAAHRAEEGGVRRQRSSYIDVLTARALDRGDDLLLLLATSEQAVLAGVRVDPAHRDSWRPTE